MPRWFHIFPKQTGLSLYIWLLFCILPFYFVVRSSSPLEIALGIVMIILFYAAYQLLFLRTNWTVYAALGIEIAINLGMTLYFGYVYFALFLAYFIGNVRQKAGFIALYAVHLTTTVSAVVLGFFVQRDLFVAQLPFIVVCVLGVIFLPLTMYHRAKRKQLEEELEHAQVRISELLVAEERQRIARDLHDTLGQKLSLIGLKSDLARRLVDLDPQQAKQELLDIHRTARTALKEVREIISTMKHVKLKEELQAVRQMLQAAGIELAVEGDPDAIRVPLLVENVLSMCLREAVTNVVKHSGAAKCRIAFRASPSEYTIRVADDGRGIAGDAGIVQGHGLRGMRERLEFVNGSLHLDGAQGAVLTIQVPRVVDESGVKEGLS
jgi:two-component system sensor histidine kinase DesK